MAKPTPDLIDEQVAWMLEHLSTLEPGSKEHQALVEDIATLQRLNIENNRNSDEWEAKERELEIKERELEAEKKKHRNCMFKELAIAFGSLAISGGIYWAGLKLGFKFEENGTIASKHTRDVIAAEQSFVRRNL